MTIIGYARVSTTTQNLSLQLDALRKAGAERIFEDDGISGTRASRPELDRCLAYLRPMDVLVVWKLDRLGRSTLNTLALLAELKDRGVMFRSITERMDTSGPMGEAMLTITAAFAQLERDVMVERTKAGLAAARAQGRVGGRPKSLDPKKVELVQSMYNGGTSVKDISALIKVSGATIYRYLNFGVQAPDRQPPDRQGL